MGPSSRHVQFKVPIAALAAMLGLACSPYTAHRVVDVAPEPTPGFIGLPGVPVSSAQRLCSFDERGAEGQLGCRLDSGNFADPNAVPSRRLSAVAWNLARGEAFARELEVLRQLDADFLLLSEVDRLHHRSGNRVLAAEIAEALSMNYVFAVEFVERDSLVFSNVEGEHGQAILSKYPLGNVRVIRHRPYFPWHLDPSQPRWGNRVTLVADTLVQGELVRLITTHFESQSSEDERLETTMDILPVALASDAPLNQIFGGDLNTDRGIREPAVQRLLAAYRNPFEHYPEPICTADGRRCKQIDWLLSRGPSLVPVATEVGGFDGSDHRWLRTEFEWAPLQGVYAERE